MKLMRWPVLVAAMVLTLFPLYWLVITSIRPESEIFSSPPVYVPGGFSWSSYSAALGDLDFALALRNSTIAAGLSSLASVVLASFAGYGFSRMKFRFQNGMFMGVLLARMVPFILLVIPLHLAMTSRGLTNNIFALGWVYTAINLPFAVWIITEFMREIPISIEEASRVAGASTLTTLRRVILPLALPGVGTAAILNFIIAWNEFMFASISTGPDTETLPVRLVAFVQQFGIEWGPMTAAAVMMVIPPALMTFIVAERLIQGLKSL